MGYRLSRVDGIYETHLRVDGVKRLSYSATGDSSIAGGDSVAELQVGIRQPLDIILGGHAPVLEDPPCPTVIMLPMVTIA